MLSHIKNEMTNYLLHQILRLNIILLNNNQHL
jgi:hypothetical protein